MIVYPMKADQRCLNAILSISKGITGSVAESCSDSLGLLLLDSFVQIGRQATHARPLFHNDPLLFRQIQPGKPNQNAYIESFNGRFRDECLNEHWFMTLAHAKVIIESWHREYNEYRPKKSLGGLTPAAHARKMAEQHAVLSAVGL